MKYQIPRGTFDILPQQSWRWQKISKLFRKIASAFGYEEIVTPIFESVELFERSSGEGSDVVQKEMYRFQDRKGRWLALRPEGTAPVVRSYLENHFENINRITKLYYLGPMFRYDRPQAGRYRQFYQYGIELIGSNHPYYDAEVIAVMWCFLNALKLTDISLEINSVGCPECSANYDKALISYYEPFKQELCPDCQTRLQQNPRRLLDCKVYYCKTKAAKAPVILDYLDEACSEHFSQVQGYLKQMDIPYELNPRIVRGLDYYTNTAFEFLNNALGAQNAIGGGGRYNGLIKQMGGKDIPAIGFAGGFERLLMLLDKQGISLGEKPNPDAHLILMGEEAQRIGIPLLMKLRNIGFCVSYDAEKSTLKAQLKLADYLKARYALILGEDECSQGVITVKDLFTADQQQVPLDKVIEYLSSY